MVKRGLVCGCSAILALSFAFGSGAQAAVYVWETIYDPYKEYWDANAPGEGLTSGVEKWFVSVDPEVWKAGHLDVRHGTAPAFELLSRPVNSA
jgi:hypothetical protein